MSQSIPDPRAPRGEPSASAARSLRPWLLGAAYWLALLPLTVSPKHSGNVLSRYMTIEAIVERGTLSIETSPLYARSGSPDVVKFGRHLYSDKPPVLPALSTVVYAPLVVLGYRFSGPPPQFAVANLALVWCVVGSSSALVVVALRKLLDLVPAAPWQADVAALAFGFASPLLTYAVTFNNHGVAAALLTWALVLSVREGGAARRREFATGVLAGLAATIDLPAGGALGAALGLWLAWRARKLPLAYVAGMLPALLLHAWLQSKVTGTPLPAELYPEALAFPGSYWASQAGQWKETVPRWQFGLEFLAGPQGWLTVTPVLWSGVVGLGLTLSRREDPLRSLALVIGGTVAVLLVYYVWGVRRTDFAGQSFGVRHLLPITPAVFVFAWAAVARSRLGWPRWLFWVLMLAGGVYAVAGAADPWSRIERRAPAEPALRFLQRFTLWPWSSYGR